MSNLEHELEQNSGQNDLDQNEPEQNELNDNEPDQTGPEQIGQEHQQQDDHQAPNQEQSRGDKRSHTNDHNHSGKKQKLEDGRAKQECKFWAKGECKFGTNCRSLHDPDAQLKAAAKAAGKELCKFFQTGTCKFGTRCKAFHPPPTLQPVSGTSFRPNLLPLSAGMFLGAAANPLIMSPFAMELIQRQQQLQQLQHQSLRQSQQRALSSSSSSSRTFVTPVRTMRSSKDDSSDNKSSDNKSVLSPSSHTRTSALGSSSRDSSSSGHGSGSKTTKDEPCKFFARGECKFGSRCEFRHEQRQSSSSSSRSSASSQETRSAYFSSPSQPTVRPSSSSSSSSLNRLQPLSTRVVTLTNTIKQSPASKKDGDQICGFWLRGDCKFGSQCRQSHSSRVSAAPTSGGMRLRGTGEKQNIYSAALSSNSYLHQQQQQPYFPNQMSLDSAGLGAYPQFLASFNPFE